MKSIPNFDQAWSIDESKRNVFIVNPKAGKESCTQEIERFTRRLRNNGINAIYCESEKEGDCEKIAKKISETATKESQVNFYACGGDGTLNEVLNGIMESSKENYVALTHIPRGSGNDFIKCFKNPKAFDPKAYIEDEITTKKIDIIKVNERYCLNIVSFGLDARIGTGVSDYRGILSGKSAYNMSVISNILKPIGKYTRVEDLDNQETITNELTAMICVCNGSWYGGSYNPIPEANIQDGKLEILVVNETNRLRAIALIKDYKKGNYKKHPKVMKRFTLENLRITTFVDEPINLDGEKLLAKKIDIKILPSKLNFFAPKSAW